MVIEGGGGNSCRDCGVFEGYTDFGWEGEDGIERSKIAVDNQFRNESEIRT